MIADFVKKGIDFYRLIGRKLLNNQAFSLTFPLPSREESLQLEHFWQVNQNKLGCILSNSILKQEKKIKKPKPKQKKKN